MPEYQDLAQRIRDDVQERIVEPEFKGYTHAKVTRVETEATTVLIFVEVMVTVYADKEDR